MKSSSKLLLTSAFIFAISISSNQSLSDDKLNEIESRINSMNYESLIATRSNLLLEQDELETDQENTQSPSQNKTITERLAEINAELSAIQRALVGLVGIAAVSAITDDGYNDEVPPVITINGDNPATVELGTSYTDAGATANDAFHGTTAVTSSGTVDVNTVGSYTITYTATDLDNNTATATRTVNVVDTTAPVVTVTGDNPATHELGTTYTDAGATATDASGTVTVTSSGTVDSDTLGTYTITYTSTDASGNTGTATRTVNVVDTTAPVVTVTGDNPATHELGTTYTDAGATATDASGTVTVTSSGTVDSDTLGTYTITYTSTDASGNTGTATRTVNVVDTTAPVFTSQSTFIVDEGATDVGTVTATDLQAVTFTLSGNDDLTITTDGVLTFKAPADYESQSDNPSELKYDGSTYDITATVTATDASDNAADQIITVKINDVGGLDDKSETGTATNTSTAGTGTATATATSSTATATSTSSTSTATSTSESGTSTATSTSESGTSTATSTSESGTSTGTGTGTGTGTELNKYKYRYRNLIYNSNEPWKERYCKNIFLSKAHLKGSISSLVLEEFLSIIKYKNKVKISNFGVFTVSVTKPRVGRNPSTKKEYHIPKRKKLTFKASSQIKTILN